MALPQVSSSDCRGLFPVLAWAAFAHFGKHALSGRTPAPAASREGLPSQTPAPLQEKSCMHIPASRLITSVLSEKICFSGTSFCQIFWALIFHVLGGCWAEIMLLPAVQSKCLARQLNHKTFIHSISVLVNILAQPQASLHQKQMVLPTLPTCLKSRGQKVFGELSWKCPKLFPNCSVTQH